MLLEMAFVFKPYIHFRLDYQSFKSFYMPLALPGFTSAKPELIKQTLALTYAKSNLLSFSQMMAKKLSIPKILLIPKFTGGTSQIFLKNITDFFCYCTWPARFIHVFETLKTALFKTAHPKYWMVRRLCLKRSATS